MNNIELINVTGCVVEAGFEYKGTKLYAIVRKDSEGNIELDDILNSKGQGILAYQTETMQDKLEEMILSNKEIVGWLN